jgi:hypothetical protein
MQLETEKGKGEEKEKEMNLLIFVAAVLDPKYKLSEYTELAIEEMYGQGTAQKIWAALNKCLHELFEEYRATYSSPPSDGTPQSSASPQGRQSGGAGMMKSIVSKKMRLNNGSSSCSKGSRTELDKYLAEECEDDETKKFDLLS